MKKILFFFILLATYSGLTIISERGCRELENNKCNLIRNIVYPGTLFIEGFSNTYSLLLNFYNTGSFIQSGLIAADTKQTIDRFKNFKSEFTFNYEKNTKPYAGYLILSRPDPSNNLIPSIEIWNLNTQERIHKYDLNHKKIAKTLGSTTKNLNLVHPLLLNDGSIVVKAKKNLIKLNKCGILINKNQNNLYHHSVEIDPDGNIYVPIYKSSDNIDLKKFPKGFLDDGFAVLDSDLNLIKTYSLLEIYKQNGLIADIFGQQILLDDPFHLNDVQPYTSFDGSKLLILSLRNQSSVMAMNPKTKDIIWKIDNAFLMQHDVDVISEINKKIKISIFDNNVMNYVYPFTDRNRFITFEELPIKSNNGFITINNKNEHKKYKFRIYDFNDLEKFEVPRTVTGGRADFIPENNSIMVEETNYGRLVETDTKDGKILWQFINKSEKDNIPYMVSWSKRLKKLPGNLVEKDFNKCKKNNK